ncbi:aldo/keto reductase [soil metagenome]
MLYRPFGNSDLHTSVVALGTMSWPGCNYGYAKGTASAADLDAATRMVGTALDGGINFFDTAEGYGRGLAEEMLGLALERLQARDRAIIVTKVGPLFETEQIDGRPVNLSRAHLFERCEQSLRRLRTDHIDLYLAHRPDDLTPIEETMAAVATLKEQGKIRWFGVSNFSAAQLSEALAHGPVVANQLPYSLVDRGIDTDQRPFCEKHNVGIMAYSPIGKGILSGKYDASHLPPADDYRHQRKHFAAENLPHHLAIAQQLRELAPAHNCTPAQLALAWTFSQPGITVALPGVKSPEQVASNAAAGDVKLSATALASLDALSR